MSHTRILGASLALVLVSCATAPAAPRSDRDQADATKHFHSLLDAHWQYFMATNPEMATSIGYPGYDDQWTDMSLAGITARKAETREYLTRLETIDRAQLSEADRLNYDVFHKSLAESVAGQRFPGEYLAVSQLGGVYQDIPQTFEIMPKATRQDLENILARLSRAPELVTQHMVLLETGRRAGIVQPSVILRDVPELVLRQVPEKPDSSPMLQAFRTMPEAISEVDRARLHDDATRIYREQLRPALLKYHDYLVDTYIPSARNSIGLTALPDGAAWYASAIEESTTTDLTPNEIFELGLKEVKRIQVEMLEVMTEAGFSGTMDEFMAFMRTDSRFYFTDAGALIAEYRDIAKRADAAATRQFGRLPRLTYGVEPVPEYMEESHPTAYYRRGSIETGRPGIFYANTYDLKSRPKWGMEALVLHEAVPGHHLQIALAQEMDDVPEFRRWGGAMAFIEGWGLYAESLGSAMGFYRDPYTRFGLLASEMWRAVRLVVDTGMHAKGWSRQQAIDYFMEHTGRVEHEAVVEIDRYIAWPAQALSYKIGAITIAQLGRDAERALGDRFDIREFHDRVLADGALPLDILEQRVKAWIAMRQAGSGP